MNKTHNPEEYLKAPYARILIPSDDGTFSAEILEIPGCFAQGATPNEAFRNLEASAKSWIQSAIAQGIEIPEPQMNQGYGGKIALRLPRSLHRQASRLAEHDGTSLNQFLVTAIATSVGADSFSLRLEHRIRQAAAHAVIAITATLTGATAALPNGIGISGISTINQARNTHFTQEINLQIGEGKLNGRS